MNTLKYIITIPAIIILSLEGTNARSTIIHHETTATNDDPHRLKITREHIGHYYKELAQKFPKMLPQATTTMNIEKKYNVDLVSPEEAPLILGLALLEGGDAPKANKWFVNFYDPYGESGLRLPKEGYAANFRADLRIGLHHQWPEFIFAIKVQNKVRKQPKDAIQRKVYAVNLRVNLRPSIENLTSDFYQVKPIIIQSTIQSDQFAPQIPSLTRAFAARKNLWQTKRGPIWRQTQVRSRG